MQGRQDMVGIVCSVAEGQELLAHEAHGKEFVFPPKYNKKAMVFIKLQSSWIVFLEDDGSALCGVDLGKQKV